MCSFIDYALCSPLGTNSGEGESRMTSLSSLYDETPGATVTIKYKGRDAGKTSSTYDLYKLTADTANDWYLAAINKALDLHADFNGVSDAGISTSITFEIATQATPTAATADVFENAELSLWLSDEKFAKLRVAAPIDGIFVAATGRGRNVVDINDTDLAALVDEFGVDQEGDSAVAVLSDRELVDTTIIVGGIDKGKRVGRRYNPKV